MTLASPAPAASGAKKPSVVLMLKGAYEAHGGTETVISGFVDHLDRSKYVPILVILAKKGAPKVAPLVKDPALLQQIEVFWPGMLKGGSCARELIELVGQHNVDLIHSHDCRSTLAAWHVKRLMPSIPWVSHMHGWLGKTGILKNQLVEGLAKRLQRKADMVVGGSKHTCSEVEQLGMKRMHVLPNGVPLPPLDTIDIDRATVRQNLGIDPSAVVLGVTSRLHPGKGHRYLFEAFKMLHPKHPTARIIVVGDGDHRAVLEQQACELGLADVVKFAGRVPAVFPYLVAADIFCLPSLKESLSMAVLEAMAARRCTVTTDVGDFRTLIRHGENGLIVPPANAQALADAIAPLLTDAARRERLAAAARQTIEERFSVAIMVRNLEAIFDETLAATGKR